MFEVSWALNAPNSGSESFNSQMPCARALRDTSRVHFSASAMSDVPARFPSQMTGSVLA